MTQSALLDQKDIDIARKLGEDAYMLGCPYAKAPYENDVLVNAWRQGWVSASKDIGDMYHENQRTA